jgi:hypothetical protein
MKIKNISKRLIVLNYLENSKARKSLQLGAGSEVENEHLTTEDIAFYVKRESIVKLDEILTNHSTDNKAGTKADPILLPDEKTLESLIKVLTIKDMKQYWKDNNIGKVTGLSETELATGILTQLGIEIKNEDENLTPAADGGSED